MNFLIINIAELSLNTGHKFTCHFAQNNKDDSKYPFIQQKAQGAILKKSG